MYTAYGRTLTRPCGAATPAASRTVTSGDGISVIAPWRGGLALAAWLAVASVVQTTYAVPRSRWDTRPQSLRDTGTSTSEDGAGMRRRLQAGGSVFCPTYIAEGTVYTRRVADMPLAENSAAIAAYMPTQPAQYNKMGVVTVLNARFYNLPVYVVDSRDPGTPRVRVNVPEFRDHMVSQRMRRILFSDDIPIPDWAKAANPQGGGTRRWRSTMSEPA